MADFRLQMLVRLRIRRRSRSPPRLPQSGLGISFPGMSTLTIELPDDLKGALAQAARRSGTSPARFVRKTLEQRLKPVRASSRACASLYELSRDLCGSVAGGPRDLASNKSHLAGYGSWKR